MPDWFPTDAHFYPRRCGKQQHCLTIHSFPSIGSSGTRSEFQDLGPRHDASISHWPECIFKHHGKVMTRILCLLYLNNVTCLNLSLKVTSPSCIFLAWPLISAHFFSNIFHFSILCIYFPILFHIIYFRFNAQLDEDDSLLCLYQHLGTKRPSILDVSWKKYLCWIYLCEVANQYRP